MLHNPYYFGVVPYRGVYYEGKHEPLISVETWLRIQDVLTAHNVAGEKTRKHPHYLKGTIFCGECHARLVYSRNRGRGGVYEYFICLSRKTKRRPCSRTVTRLDKIEVGIADFYRRFQLGQKRIAAIRQAVRTEIALERADAEATQDRARKQLRQVKDEREKLLHAYYAGAVPPDLLKTEMDRLTRELTVAGQQLQATAKSLDDLDNTLEEALGVVGHCGQEYLTARPQVRRQINQGLFKKLFISRDGTVERYELTEPFAQLLDHELAGDGPAEAYDVTLPEQRQAVEAPDGRMRPSNVFTATFGEDLTSNQPDGEAVRLGLHNEHLVRVTRL